MSAIRTLTLASVLLMGATQAQAGEAWSLDPAHSRVGFRVSHMMISSVEGRFTDVSGSLELEPGQLSDLSVQVEVAMNSVETGIEQRDEHLRTADFLDVANHPTMSFVSKKVKTHKGGFDLTGVLTIRGVSKTVTFQGSGLDAVVIDPWGNQRVGAHATTTIDRQDFGVAYNQLLETGGVMVGDDLQLQIDVEFIRPVAR